MPAVGMLSGRSSDLQAAYLLQLPSPWLDQCLGQSVRSCLPLRGSSGFSPDSLLSLISRSGTRKYVQYSAVAPSRSMIESGAPDQSGVEGSGCALYCFLRFSTRSS